MDNFNNFQNQQPQQRPQQYQQPQNHQALFNAMSNSPAMVAFMNQKIVSLLSVFNAFLNAADFRLNFARRER